MLKRRGAVMDGPNKDYWIRGRRQLLGRLKQRLPPEGRHVAPDRHRWRQVIVAGYARPMLQAEAQE